MSPRAAARLESLGFREVYDYVAGEADWFASGLPMEGTNAGLRHAGDFARRDVPICQLAEPLHDVTSRVRDAGWDICAVVNAERVVLGLLRRDRTDTAPAATVEHHMELGPSTFRPDATLDQPLAYMRRRSRSGVLVTLSDGRLVGFLTRADAEHAEAKGER